MLNRGLLTRKSETIAYQRVTAKGWIGVSSSGKTLVFGTSIPRFESWCPSQLFWLMTVRLQWSGAGVNSPQEEGKESEK